MSKYAAIGRYAGRGLGFSLQTLNETTSVGSTSNDLAHTASCKRSSDSQSVLQSLSRTRKTRLFAGLLTAALSFWEFTAVIGPTPATQNQARLRRKPQRRTAKAASMDTAAAPRDPSPAAGGDHALCRAAISKYQSENRRPRSAQAKVTIVAFFRFPVPFCQRAEQTLRR